MTSKACPHHRSRFAGEDLERRIDEFLGVSSRSVDRREVDEAVAWRCEQMAVTTSLEAYLDALPDSRILELAGERVGDGGKWDSSGHAELVRRALRVLTADADELITRVYPFGPQRMRQVRDLLSCGGVREMVKEPVFSPVVYLREAYSLPPLVLLFDDGERLVQVMPREVAEVLGTLDNRRWRIHERRADEWRRCLDRIEALVDLRGVVPFADAVRECELCVEGNADGDLLMRYLVDEPWAASTDVTVDLLGDDIFLVFPDLYDIFGDDDDGLFMEEFCLDLADAQSAHAPRDVTNDIVSAGGVTRHLLATDEARALLAFLDAHVPEGFSDRTYAIELAYVLIMLLRSNDGAHVIDEALLGMGLRATGRMRMRLHALADALDRIVPKWHLNGWCERDLAELTGFVRPEVVSPVGAVLPEGGYEVVEEGLGSSGSDAASHAGVEGSHVQAPSSDVGREGRQGVDAKGAFVSDDAADRTDEMRRRNDGYLREYENWLFEVGHVRIDVAQRVTDVSTFLNFFCVEHEGIEMREGAGEVGRYLGNLFIRRVMWSTPDTIRTTAGSIKEFYRCMHAYGHVEKHEVDFVLREIKDNIDGWCLRCEQYNDPDSESPFDVFDLI